MTALAGWERFQTDTRPQVVPVRIVGFDQADLPGAVPVLQLLLTRNGCRHVGEEFVANKAVHGISRCETAAFPVAMLVHAFEQVCSHANVQCSARLTGENVDAWLLRHLD